MLCPCYLHYTLLKKFLGFVLISSHVTNLPVSNQQTINSWLPQAETKFANMSKIAADPRSAKIQIEELKVSVVVIIVASVVLLFCMCVCVCVCVRLFN